MKTTIYCKPTAKGVHSFCLMIGSDEFYLFTQSYRKDVEEYYGRGVRIDEAIKYSRAHGSPPLSGQAGSAELTKACNAIGGCKTGDAMIG